MQDDVLEVLSHNNQNFIPVSRTRVTTEDEHDTDLHLRLLAWSEDAEFLAMTTGNGRVFIFDEIGKKWLGC